jgi:hypothetical protein
MSELALQQLIGLYFVHWSSFELAVDIGFTKFTGETPQVALKRTRKWTLSKKVDKLKKLVEKSDHSDREQIVQLLTNIPQESLRNVIAHCYMRFGSDKVIFLQRTKGGVLIREEMSSEALRLRLNAASKAAHSLSELLKNTNDDAERHYNAL